MKLHQRFVFLIILVLLGLACHKDTYDLMPKATNDFNAEARSFYENFNNGKGQVLPQTLSAAPEPMQPQWKKATEFKTSKYDFIEVPLLKPAKKMGIYNFGQNILAQADKNLILNTSFQRLLIYRDKAGTFRQGILTYIPDAGYLKKYQDKAAENRLNKMDSGFSGYLEYSDLTGNVVQIIRYENGKAIKKFLPHTQKTVMEKGGISIQSAQLFEICTDWYQWDFGRGEWYYIDTRCRSFYAEVDDGGGPGDIGFDPCPGGNCEGPGGPGGSSGGAYTPPQGPTPKIIAGFCINSETTDEAKDAIKASIQAYSTRNCVTKYIYNTLDAVNFNITFCVKPLKVGSAAYNPVTGTLTFTNFAMINFDTDFDHEMFHAFQKFYYGNTEQYAQKNGVNSPGNVNIEFERALMADIAKGYTSAFSGVSYEGTPEQKRSYNLWFTKFINDFRRHGVPEPGTIRFDTFMTNYFDQLNEFNSMPGNPYSSPVINTLKPDGLYSILERNIDCL